jgi:hypothetical protein
MVVVSSIEYCKAGANEQEDFVTFTIATTIGKH